MTAAYTYSRAYSLHRTPVVARCRRAASRRMRVACAAPCARKTDDGIFITRTHNLNIKGVKMREFFCLTKIQRPDIVRTLLRQRIFINPRSTLAPRAYRSSNLKRVSHNFVAAFFPPPLALFLSSRSRECSLLFLPRIHTRKRNFTSRNSSRARRGAIHKYRYITDVALPGVF